MTLPYDRPIDHLSAWKSSDFKGPDDFAYDLTPRRLTAFDRALGAIHAAGLKLDDTDRRHFELREIASELAALRDEVLDGRGFLMIRGFPVGRYSQADIELMFWGLGTHFGLAQSQSVLGDRLGHMMDMTPTDPHARAYRNKQALTLHTDLCDVVAILSLQTSANGGDSLFASALAVHNEILTSHPEHLPFLYRGAPYHRRGEELPGQLPWTPHDVPVLSQCQGVVSCRYVREYIIPGAEAAGRPLSAQEIAALDCFDAIANRPDVCLRFVVEPGTAIFFNNWTVLHGRAAFEDGDDKERRRHLLRLWLEVPGARPVVPETAVYETVGIAPQAGKTPSYVGIA